MKTVNVILDVRDIDNFSTQNIQKIFEGVKGVYSVDSHREIKVGSDITTVAVKLELKAITTELSTTIQTLRKNDAVAKISIGVLPVNLYDTEDDIKRKFERV
jgi:hypothetical protein